MDISEILTKYREQVIEEWIDRLLKVSPRYGKRSRDELYITVAGAYDASYAVLVNNDFSRIDCHIHWITQIRLRGDFSLSEVQNAYELYRTTIFPVFVKELKGDELRRAMEKLNGCLFYTITKFSDFFQSLHEKQIRNHAENLEQEVAERTKELGESEAKYRVLIEEINDGYFVNQDENIIFANQAFCDLHGYTLQEIIGKPYTELVAPKYLPAVKRFYEQRMTGEDTRDLYMYYRRHKNGSNLPTENKVKRILYQGRYAAAGICRDITERMETERRIRESERLAHIGKLTTSLAHEIRNPLSSVKMNSQIILKNTEFNGNDKRRMEIIFNETSRLERILDEMLNFAKPIRLNFEPVSIHNVIDSCLEIVDVKMKEKGILVKKRYGKKIPGILLDHDRIEQAVINVLLNSVEALQDGGEITIITRHEAKGKGTIQIEIFDNGPGISPDDLPYIFDPFFSNKKKGTGLGLSNVKKIIEAHGGTVHTASRKPQGIHVFLTIPARKTV
ncbi:MAG: PAS domain S-box protein [Syntrophorhabdaceae bacterium]|nr:PAS domain S-box protein [Syntrophorhabdaceae bacterium]MDD5243321.1 PAS domain S-box protein [Syntrophorhabdaceae bacterium]